ncbi:hypothetical protein D3C75_1134920 [compost metagenome]
MILGPVNHPFDLWPVGNVTEIDQPQRRPGDNQSVEILILNIFKITVKVIQMLRRRVL